MADEAFYVPALISDYVKKMNDPGSAFWQRENFKMTLEKIANYCTEEVAKYEKKKKR